MVYLITDASDKGAFINELEQEEYLEYVEFGESELKGFACPSCTDGILVKITKGFNSFYGCSNYCKGCTHKTFPVCPKCHNGPLIYRKGVQGKSLPTCEACHSIIKYPLNFPSHFVENGQIRKVKYIDM